MKDTTKTIKDIEEILYKLEIKPSLIGYKYWILAILIALDSPNANMITLYEKIAEINKTTRAAVERGLRYARIESKKVIEEYFKVSYKIDNVALLALIVKELGRDRYGC